MIAVLRQRGKSNLTLLVKERRIVYVRAKDYAVLMILLCASMLFNLDCKLHHQYGAYTSLYFFYDRVFCSKTAHSISSIFCNASGESSHSICDYLQYGLLPEGQYLADLI